MSDHGDPESESIVAHQEDSHSVTDSDMTHQEDSNSDGSDCPPPAWAVLAHLNGDTWCCDICEAPIDDNARCLNGHEPRRCAECDFPIIDDDDEMCPGCETVPRDAIELRRRIDETMQSLLESEDEKSSSGESGATQRGIAALANQNEIDASSGVQVSVLRIGALPVSCEFMWTNPLQMAR